MSTKNDGGPDAEPVAWLLRPIVQRHPNRTLIRGCYTAEPGREQHECAALDGDEYVPLYSQPPKRKPLPLEHILDLWKTRDKGLTCYTEEALAVEFSRAVERAHGIGDE